MKPTSGDESLHHDSNDNGFRIVNFAISKILDIKSTVFPYSYQKHGVPIQRHSYLYIDLVGGKTHNQIDHILLYRRLHSSILNVRIFRRVDCDTDHNLVVAKFRGILTVSKQAAQNLDWE